MRSILSKLFSASESQAPLIDQEHVLRVSTATLLIEVCRADFQVQESELDRMKYVLIQQFSLSGDEVDELMLQAQKNADKLVSLQHITRLLNENLDASMKIRVVEMMWHVVYADGVKDHYEEHLIRQVSELLYVPHSMFIRARHKAEQSIEN